MASLVSYTKGSLVERIEKHLESDFPGADFKLTPREILLYIDQSLAFTLVGQVYQMAKVEGNIALPEGWLTTYNVSTPTVDAPSGYWFCTLPQPPVSLPLGYSINRVYTAIAGSGQSFDFFAIKAKRVGIRKYMPLPTGARYWVTGTKLWLAASDGSSLSSFTIYVEMAKTRTESMNETMNLPDDAIEAIFQDTIKTISQRFSLPQDQVLDNLPQGNKAS